MRYIEELGIDPKKDCRVPRTKDKDCARQKRFKKQRKKFGFDERETWDLDWTFACWLYEHIRMYEDIGGKIVDLNYDYAKIMITDYENPHQFKSVTLQGAIDELKNLLMFYIKQGQDAVTIEEDKKAFDSLKNAAKLWSEIIEYMWW